MARANFLTVEEAGRVLRIGRTAAYEAAKRFRVTGGTEGLPVVAVGGSLRVPVARLEEWAGGPLDMSVLDAPTDVRAKPRANSERTRRPTPSRQHRAPAPRTPQQPLPFTG